ncbi:hybrid sensor histidine kinase/response regulator transcription factor [Jiangella alkaliphila]|uniref:Histidine kinase-, DNA gyrase B-, and HSP90-like ATPase n=1 Tax=Jiangella alkaliphila TaxID=419479 RepID=A0A1H2LRJ9_9ACTN|nr:response regulator [Jiangella alkaliphila]SDU83472.1 Histidine kinase-, DNA gyrase B-, and HSP90-like ATPase [Jiangella alkaliphila]
MGQRRHEVERTAEARADALASVVEDLAGKFSLRPLLDRILRRSVELLGADAGSICSVDETAGVYRKEADFGIACQSGRSFPLSEGMTGAVVAARAPLVFAEYAQVPGGHVSPADRATLHGVIGVPIAWRDSVIGACIVFSRDPDRTFTDDDARLLELFAKHAAIAIVNARMHEQLEERTRAEATAAERERLVREVHDSVAQGLAAVLVHLEGATEQDGGRLAAAREAARGALAESRRTALGLPPSLLEGHSLEEAIGVEVAWARATGNLDAKLVVAGQPAPLTPELAHQAFRIVQEALTNIVQHAAASSARVGVVYGPDELVLMVQDDGRGFDRAASQQPGHGFGLRGIVARTRTYGGTVEVESTPGWGTQIRAGLPYQPAETGDPDGTAAPRLRVLVVDDQPVTRAGLARLLAAAEPGVQVVAEIDSAPALLDAYRLLRPDVVLVDAYLGGHDGVECTRQLVAEDPGAAVLLLGATAGDPIVGQALRAGARGCVGPDADGPELARAVLAAAHGGITLSASVRDGLPRPAVPDADGAALTVREREVRDLLERGLRDKQIAERLNISVKTVEKHVGAVLRKTGASSRTEVAARGAARR